MRHLEAPVGGDLDALPQAGLEETNGVDGLGGLRIFFKIKSKKRNLFRSEVPISCLTSSLNLAMVTESRALRMSVWAPMNFLGDKQNIYFDYEPIFYFIF